MAKKFNLPDELNKSTLTCTFRASYQHVTEPWAGKPGDDRRYSIQMIFDKDEAWVKKAKNHVKAVATEAFGPTAVKLLRGGKLHNPFRDGDDEFPDNEVYQGKIFVNANGAYDGKRPPHLVDQKRNPIREMPDPDAVFYSGCYARAEIKFYPYDRDGGKGIACFLFGVQKVRNGETLGGGKSADEMFEELEDEDGDDSFDNDPEDFDDDAPF